VSRLTGTLPDILAYFVTLVIKWVEVLVTISVAKLVDVDVN
jgi:hypothetical protein